MKKNIYILFIFTLINFNATSQINNLSGPRVGAVFISASPASSFLRGDLALDQTGELPPSYDDFAKGSLTSLYGWQFESRFADGYDVTGIVEWIILVGGMEKGFFLPSVSSMVGVRTAKGIELAVGPNLSLGGIAMVIGAGYNFKFGNLNLPVNVAYVPSMNKTYDHEAEYDHTHMWDDEGNPLEPVLKKPAYSVTHPTGARVSIMVGFNLSK